MSQFGRGLTFGGRGFGAPPVKQPLTKADVFSGAVTSASKKLDDEQAAIETMKNQKAALLAEADELKALIATRTITVAELEAEADDASMHAASVAASLWAANSETQQLVLDHTRKTSDLRSVEKALRNQQDAFFEALCVSTDAIKAAKKFAQDNGALLPNDQKALKEKQIAAEADLKETELQDAFDELETHRRYVTALQIVVSKTTI